MPSDNARITTLCERCHRAVARTPHLPSGLPNEPRHIGFPGEPIDCPK